MKKLALICLLLTFGCSLSYAESIQSLSKNEVLKALENKTITTVPLVTLHGKLVPNTVSVYFGKQEMLVGKFAEKPKNDPQNDQGTWQVKDDGQFCVSWKVWTNNRPICVYTYKLANSLVFINTDKKFESMVLTDSIQSGNQLHS
jgi:hypothetical protein